MPKTLLVFLFVLTGFLTISVGCSNKATKAEIPETFEPPPKEGPVGFGEKASPK